MAEALRRVETTHADEITRTATGSVQWFLEQRNKEGTHPITLNNKLSFFICGEDAFADIAAEIRNAKQSIDLCCWGFDPGMELLRDGFLWPRGPTFGDLLIEAGKKGVTVRLLVWYDIPGSRKMKNMPGHTHGLHPWLLYGGDKVRALHATRSLAMAQAANKGRAEFDAKFGTNGFGRLDANRFPLGQVDLHAAAREEYCFHWYRAAFAGELKNVHVRTRGTNCDANQASIDLERIRPDAGEEALMVHHATHHQKPILIDYAYEEGRKAIGYVMGLNSVTDYWDTCEHKVDDLQRERGGEKEAKESVSASASGGFPTLKPYHDYACRIDAGRSLICLHKNFANAWNAAQPEDAWLAAQTGNRNITLSISKHLLRKPSPGECAAQIVRTYPPDKDQTIKELYFHAADQAANAVGYLYIENQYFQYEEWCQRLLATRRKVVAQWQANAKKAGRSAEDMPMLHIFIVIPVPELAEMVPRTYDALATLGQQNAMAGQQDMIDRNNHSRSQMDRLSKDGRVYRPASHHVVEHANTIHKPSLKQLENEFGVRISVCMLNSCGMRDGKWVYREIYNHSKLMIIDDSLVTLGSANLNQRSMAADSEINIVTDSPSHARTLRERIISMHGGNKIEWNEFSRQNIMTAAEEWSALAEQNLKKRRANSKIRDDKLLDGFIVALDDERSSLVRLA